MKNNLKKLSQILKDVKYVMLSSLSSDGEILNRPMVILNSNDFQGKLWFFIRKNSTNGHDIKEGEQVGVSFINVQDELYLSLSGITELSRERELFQKFWTPLFETWFPDGVTDPNLSLLGVDIESASLWHKNFKEPEVFHFKDLSITPPVSDQGSAHELNH